MSRQSSPYQYFAFGLSVVSDWVLPCDARPRNTWETVRLQARSDEFFAARVSSELRQGDPRRITFHDLAHGSRYLLWRNSFEFHISSDSRVITGRSLDEQPQAAFQTYLLGHLFAYIVLGLGLETTHAVTMVMDGAAVAFLGDSAYGKSTLAAGLIRMGYRLLSDDFLVIRQAEGQYWAYPGMPRIKLYENVAQQLIPNHRRGWPMFEGPDPKFIYPVEDLPLEPLSMAAFYELSAPEPSDSIASVTLTPMNERDAYLALTRNTFNVRVTSAARLKAQFEWATKIVRKVPVKRLDYPRVLSVIPAVADAVKADLQDKALPSTLPARNG